MEIATSRANFPTERRDGTPPTGASIFFRVK
jgi:hypothetical protein